MININVFKNKTEYNNNIFYLGKPNLSMTEDDKLIWYSKKSIIHAIYEPISTSGETKLFGDSYSFNVNDIKKMSVNGVNTPVSKTYTFNTLEPTELIFVMNPNIANMNGMFQACQSLVKINLESLYTSNVTEMAHMFDSCKNLNEITFSPRFGEKCTNMNSMFYGCSSLINLNLENFNTDNVNNMSYMFYNCVNLSSISFPENFGKICTNMNSMFHSCKKIPNINLSNLNLFNVNNMSYMFYNCNNLSLIDFSGTNNNINNVINYTSMFTRIANSGTLIYNDAFNSKWNEITVTNQSKSAFPSTWTKQTV